MAKFTDGMRPMHAQAFEPARAKFPLFIQPKYDGVRCLTIEGKPYSRTFKVLPNLAIQEFWVKYQDFLNMLDGELIVGSPTAPDVFKKTMSGVMSEEDYPDFGYYVFDIIDRSKPFSTRYSDLHNRVVHIKNSLPIEYSMRVILVPTHEVHTHKGIETWEAKFLEEGYEGVMLRTPGGFYKYGRSTAVGGELNKLKRYTDEEAKITGFQELMRNDNEAVEDNFGLQKRSSHQANKTPMGTLGALEVINDRGEKFNVGSGFNQTTRLSIWLNRDIFLGKYITYRYVKVGGYDVPRFPIFKGFRHSIDIGDPK